MHTLICDVTYTNTLTPVLTDALQVFHNFYGNQASMTFTNDRTGFCSTFTHETKTECFDTLLLFDRYVDNQAVRPATFRCHIQHEQER